MTLYLTVCLLLLATDTAVNSASAPEGLFMSNGTHILFSAKSNSLSSFVSVFSQEQGHIVGLAVDIQQGVVFWSDVSVSTKGIWRGDVDGENALQNTRRIVDSDIFEVNGLTVDWVSQHIYWTDGRKRTVEVANYDGSSRHILSIGGLQSPRGIVVDPVESYLYWNDQGSRKIERSRLDGSDRKMIVTVDAAHRQPNQMAMHDSKLYWVEAYSQELWRCESDGSQAQKVAALKAQTSDDPAFGLAITSSGQSIVSVWRQASIISVKVDGSDLQKSGLTLLGSKAVFSLAYSAASLQPAGTSACQSSGCSHICLLKDKTTPRCACPSFGGLALDTDKKRCRQPANGVLLYALADEGIVGFIDPNGAETTDRFLIGRSLRPVAVAYDPVHKVVYWSDVYEHTVHQANFDGSNHKIFLRSSTHSIGVVDGLSVDAKHGRLYYSNMGTTHVNGMAYTWHHIETIKFDGSGRRTVVTRAEKPRALWIDTDHNHLYYTSWGSQASVVRTNLDGTEPLVVLQNMDNPNGLAVGPGGKLYVIDSHDKTNRGNENYPRAKKEGTLYKSDKDGTDLAEVSGLSLELPFGLAVSSDKIYISDWKKNAILSVSGNTVTTLMSDVNTPMALFFSPVTKSFGGDTCASSDCNDICLVTPADGATCTCNSYKPKVLQTDLKACNVPSKFLLFADMDSIKMIGLDGTPDKAVYTLVQGNGYFSNFVAIAYNHATHTVYYSGVDRGKIYSVPMDGSANPSVFYSTGHVIDGLALDSANSRLYWTVYTTGDIAYKELSGDNNSTVFLAGDKTRKPRALLEHQGYIYWTEWGDKARVARKSVSSGSDETILSAANAEGLDRLNGLSIMKDKLYIGDASGRVFESTLDGSSAKRLRYISASHIYSLYAENDVLWYTDWKAHSLSRVNLDTGRVEVLATGLMRPSQVIVHYDGAPTVCPTTHNCEETCNAVPGGYECSCPDGEMLKLDKAHCERAVSKYVEVDSSQCVGKIGALKGNKVCGRKIGSTDVKAVCKAGHGGSSCDACSKNHFKSGAGDEDCTACSSGSVATGTGNTACKCSGSNVWDWKDNQCSATRPGTCPVISMQHDSICGSSTCSGESDCTKMGQKCCSVAGCGSSGNKHCVNPVSLTECVYEGTIYQVGATFSPNPCMKCRCDFDKTFGDHRYGNAVCSVTDCPVLECPSGRPTKVSGQCCPVCKAPDRCPDSVTETLQVDDKSNCVDFKPDWATETLQFCWTKSNDHKQTAKFKFPGLTNPCEVKVIVVDEISPKITCPQDQVQYTSKDELKIEFAQPTATDNVGLSKITRTAGGNDFPVGKATMVVFTVTDKAGNKAKCSFEVTVKKQAAAVQACKVPRPTHALLKCNDKLSCDLLCDGHYVRGPGSEQSHYECNAGTWSPPFKDSFTNLACVLKKKQVVSSSISFQLTVEADQVVFLKASLEDYIKDKFIIRSKFGNRIKLLIIIKGQDRRIRRTKRATRQMDVTIEFYIELDETDEERQKKEAEDAKKELDKLSGDLEGRLAEDIKRNEVKLDADGNNDGVEVINFKSTQAQVGCLPGEQKIESYCVVCPVGTFYERATKKCVLCAKNKYQELEGQTQCRSCPARTHSVPGSYVQAQCIADEEVKTASTFPLIIVIAAAAGVVVLIIIIIVIVVVCKRRNSSPDQEPAPRDQAHTNEAYYMQPMKGKEESEYEDIPADHAPEPPKKESEYAGLGKSQKEANIYDKVQHK